MKEMDKLQKQLEVISNKISFSIILLAVSIIIAGVLISSGLSADTNSEMYLFNMGILKASIVLAGMIILGLVISMLRSRG